MVILDRYVSEHSVTGWAADAEGRPFEYVFIEWEEGQYYRWSISPAIVVE